MGSGHEEIKEMLPDYLADSLSREARNKVETHLEECRDCGEEMAFLAELVGADVPNPGDLFWKTLPRHVKLTAEELKRSRFSLNFLFGGIPVAAVAGLLLLALTLTGNDWNGIPAGELFSGNPLTVSLSDYGDVTEKEIPMITLRLAGEDLSLGVEDFAAYSYHREVASLSSDELGNLFEALMKEGLKEG